MTRSISNILQVIGKLENGDRLSLPPGCPVKLYSVMLQCWNYEPSKRPTFQDLKISLMQEYEQALRENAEVNSIAPIHQGSFNVNTGRSPYPPKRKILQCFVLLLMNLAFIVLLNIVAL